MVTIYVNITVTINYDNNDTTTANNNNDNGNKNNNDDNKDDNDDDDNNISNANDKYKNDSTHKIKSANTLILSLMIMKMLMKPRNCRLPLCHLTHYVTQKQTFYVARAGTSLDLANCLLRTCEPSFSCRI